MKRVIVIAGGAIAAIFVIVAAVVIYVLSSLDTIIKEAVETYGSEIIRAEVRLDRVEIDASSGTGALGGLKVGYPEGFETPSAFELGEISLRLDVGTVTEDTIVIREIAITAPHITYEIGPRGNNIDAIRKNVEAYVQGLGGGGEAKAETAAEDDGGNGPRLVIEHLYIRDGSVSASANIPLMKGKTLTAALPDIHLKDIGKDTDGVAPGELVEQILAAVGNGASQAMSGIGVGKTLDSLKATLGGGADAVKGAVSGAGEAVKDAVTGVTEGVKGAASGGGSAVDDAAKGVGKTLKGIFGN